MRTFSSMGFQLPSLSEMSRLFSKPTSKVRSLILSWWMSSRATTRKTPSPCLMVAFHCSALLPLLSKTLSDSRPTMRPSISLLLIDTRAPRNASSSESRPPSSRICEGSEDSASMAFLSTGSEIETGRPSPRSMTVRDLRMSLIWSGRMRSVSSSPSTTPTRSK